MLHYLTAEISRSAVAHNVQVLRAQLPRGCRLCAVVKADCYGHCTSVLLETLAGLADCLAVATVQEGLELRSAGYEGDVLVTMALAPRVGGAQYAAVAEALAHGLQMTVTDLADVHAYAHLASKLRKPVALHAKVDTGMGRSGVLPAEAASLVRAVRDHQKLRLAGIYTHFADSDAPDKASARSQFALFQRVLQAVGPLGGAIRHAANSAAIADLPETALDMVRPGLALYGYQPSDELHSPLPLRPALRLTAPIIQTKRLPAGATVGYGHTYTLARASRVGIVPIGYGDGLDRSLGNHCPIRLGEGYAPALGRVSMDQIVIDLTDHPATDAGDTVEVITPDPHAPNSVENLARMCGTIPYEITCRLGRRVTYKAVDDFCG